MSRRSCPLFTGFAAYFNVADEVYAWGDEQPLTVDDLDPATVAEAGRVARDLGLPWPPYLPAAEEYALDHPELTR